MELYSRRNLEKYFQMVQCFYCQLLTPHVFSVHKGITLPITKLSSSACPQNKMKPNHMNIQKTFNVLQENTYRTSFLLVCKNPILFRLVAFTTAVYFIHSIAFTKSTNPLFIGFFQLLFILLDFKRVLTNISINKYHINNEAQKNQLLHLISILTRLD